MSLHKPYLSCKPIEGSKMFNLVHNCNGGIDFASRTEVDAETARLILMAIEEGKRIRSREFGALLNDNGSR